ncbi:hypothetical protein CBA19CS11_38390 [Caballeronia novacaledonica]|nr:hypothetical protein CBA19CS11_38390 [Caballeronia novacaledonica]
MTKEDIALANRIAHEVLGRTLDELPPQTRRLLKLIHAMVTDKAQREHMKRNEVRFTRRDVRDYTSWSDNQLKVHCTRLVDLEYLMIHGGSRGHWMQYELMYEGAADDEVRLAGLIDVEMLDNDERKLGSADSRLGSSCPQVGAKLDQRNQARIHVGQGFDGSQVGIASKAYIEDRENLSLTRVVDAVVVKDAE